MTLIRTDDRIYRLAQFDGDIHPPDGHPAVASQSAITLIGSGVAVFYHHGAGYGFSRLQTDLLGGNTREINEGVNRIDRILEKKPVPEPEHPQVPTLTMWNFVMCHFLRKHGTGNTYGSLA